MKNSWVDKDRTNSNKKKCFEGNGAVQNAKKNRTTKNWVKEELSKLHYKKIQTTATKETVKMSRLWKAGLFFLR